MGYLYKILIYVIFYQFDVFIVLLHVYDVWTHHPWSTCCVVTIHTVHVPVMYMNTSMLTIGVRQKAVTMITMVYLCPAVVPSQPYHPQYMILVHATCTCTCAVWVYSRIGESLGRHISHQGFSLYKCVNYIVIHM